MLSNLGVIMRKVLLLILLSTGLGLVAQTYELDAVKNRMNYAERLADQYKNTGPSYMAAGEKGDGLCVRSWSYWTMDQVDDLLRSGREIWTSLGFKGVVFIHKPLPGDEAKGVVSTFTYLDKSKHKFTIYKTVIL
jgi:hypothetical protein